MKKNTLHIIIKIIAVVLLLTLIIVVFKIAPNFVKNDDNSKINITINNNNVTKKLKYDAFKNEKNDIYMSFDDLKNYFDKYIYLDELNNQIITTYDKKIAVFPIGKKEIIINGVNKEINSETIKKEGKVFLPITQMSNVYNLDIKYIESSNILLLDSLDRQLIKVDISKNSKLKNRDRFFAGTVTKLKKGEKVVLIKKDKEWSKIRTQEGYIGYVKTSRIDNEITVRNSAIQKQNEEKINMVWDYYSEYAKTPERSGTTIEGINVVSPSFFSLVKEGNGKIYDNAGTSGKAYINWAKSNNYKVWAMVSNNSYKETTSKILNSYQLRTELINNIVKLATEYELDGINIDFENMYEKDKDAYSRFIIELTPRLKEHGRKISVDVTAPDGGETWSMCFNRNVIGDVADYTVFMAYDQYGTGSNKAGTTAGFNWVETNLKKFIDREEVKPEKIILGIPLYTRLWKEENDKVTSKVVNMNNINKTIPQEANRIWNDDLKQYYVEYIKNNATYKMWIEDETSIRNKVSLIKTYNLAGCAAWEKDRETENIWKTISEALK